MGYAQCDEPIEVTIGSGVIMNVGETLTTPVTTGPVSEDCGEDGVFAFEAEIAYDNAILSVARGDVDFDGGLVDGWFTEINADNAGMLVVNGFSTQPLVGEGLLFNITWTAVGEGTTALDMSFTYNEGDPTSIAIDGSVQVGEVGGCDEPIDVAISGGTISEPGQTFMSEVTTAYVSEDCGEDGVFAFEAEIAYDADILSVTRDDVDFDDGLVDGWFTEINADNAGMLVVNGFSTQPLVGEGLLFTINWTGESGGTTALDLTFTYNEGDPEANAIDGEITVIGGDTPPSADFEADVLSGNAPLQVAFTDLSVPGSNPITSWEWDFDNDGTIDSEMQNPTYTYDVSGVYTVSLTVSDGTLEDTETKVDYITVTDGGGGCDEPIEVTAGSGIIPEGETTVTVPLTTGYVSEECGEDGVFAFEAEIAYDAAVISITADDISFDGGLVDGWFTEINAADPGMLVVNGFNTQPLVGEGTLFNMTWTAVGAGTSTLDLTFQYNEGDPTSIAIDGSIEVQGGGGGCDEPIEVTAGSGIIPEGETTVTVPLTTGYVSEECGEDGVFAFEAEIAYDAAVISITADDISFDGGLVDGWFTEINAADPGML
ncbi:MAG: PKD domain-containing protein, partial [Gemmatimonadetes bacterium]